MVDQPIRCALLSVFYKDGIVDLAKDLHDRGVKLLSTGGRIGRSKRQDCR